MKNTITYLELPNGEKLVSWFRHDYQSKEIDGVNIFIDGGQEDYVRYSAPITWFKIQYITDAIVWIREQFTWTSNFDKDMNRIEPVKRLLKDLDDNHVEKLIDYTKNNYMTNIFKAELQFRKNESNNSRK